MLASSYPLLDIFFTMVYFVLFFVWIWLLFSVVGDVFRSHDMGGMHKALWLLFILVLPYIGLFIYLVVRGGSMHERTVQQHQAVQGQFEQYVRSAVGGHSTASELATLARLHDEGKLTDADFQAAKAKILS
jgi:ABC-type multidrug transport system fused ATPase/permease subunit